MSEEIEVHGADEQTNTGIRFTNDINDELKARIKDEAAKRIDDLLNKTEFSINDLAALSGVSHGSIKGRAKTLASAGDIIKAVLDGTRSGGKKKKPSTESVKSLLESMTPEQKAQFLAELGLTQA